MKRNYLVLFIFMIAGSVLYSGCEKLDWRNIHDHGDGGETQSVFSEKADLANDWYRLQLHLVLYSSPQYGNPVVIRLFAYEGISLFEALQPGMPNTISFSANVYQMPAMPKPETHKDYSWLLAANSALAFMTRNMLPNLTDANKASIDSLEKAYNDRLTSNAHPEVFVRSQAYGLAIAQAVFDWSKTDKFDVANAPYTPPVFFGAWQPTPLAFAPAAVPYIKNCRPFFSGHTSGITPAFPIAYSEDPTSDFFKMEKGIYDLNKSLTDEQKAIALFWNDLGIGKGYTPPGHAISIVLQIIEKEHLNLGLASMALAKCGMGSWDGFIMCFRSKYEYNLLRPVTYIRKLIDPAWLPYINTPNHPEFPAAHAYVTSAAMAAVASVIGNHHEFTDHTYDFLGYSPRNFTSLLAVGEESGMSRLYGGIHRLPSIKIGVKYGQAVGDEVGDIRTFK